MFLLFKWKLMLSSFDFLCATCLKLSFNVLPPLIIKLFKILHGGEEGMGASV